MDTRSLLIGALALYPFSTLARDFPVRVQACVTNSFCYPSDNKRIEVDASINTNPDETLRCSSATDENGETSCNLRCSLSTGDAAFFLRAVARSPGNIFLPSAKIEVHVRECRTTPGAPVSFQLRYVNYALGTSMEYEFAAAQAKLTETDRALAETDRALAEAVPRSRMQVQSETEMRALFDNPARVWGNSTLNRADDIARVARDQALAAERLSAPQLADFYRRYDIARTAHDQALAAERLSASQLADFYRRAAQDVPQFTQGISLAMEYERTSGTAPVAAAPPASGNFCYTPQGRLPMTQAAPVGQPCFIQMGTFPITGQVGP